MNDDDDSNIHSNEAVLCTFTLTHAGDINIRVHVRIIEMQASCTYHITEIVHVHITEIQASV